MRRGSLGGGGGGGGHADEVVRSPGDQLEELVKLTIGGERVINVHCKFRKTSRSFPTIFVCDIKGD